MSAIGSKKVIDDALLLCLRAYQQNGVDAFVADFHERILKQKVRFPILEHAANQIMFFTNAEDWIPLAFKIAACREIGSYVVAAIILQTLPTGQAELSFDHAIEIMIDGGEWYCCDIMAERVMGVALLNRPEKTIPLLRKLSMHEHELAVRTVGVATHYAVKKGLSKAHVEEMFLILLELSKASAFHVKTGIGWAAKTCAKFHPEIVVKYKSTYQNRALTGQWFRSKLAIGFSRNYKYASRYNH